MLFVELRFFIFLAICLAVHWRLAKNRHRKIWLLLCSYAFYAAWDWRFLGLIVGSTLVDYWVGLNLPSSTRKRRWIMLSLAVNLGALGFFKYHDFFLDNLIQLLHIAGFEIERYSLEVILPVGISFYTFQTLSYTLDIYRGHLEPRRNLLDVALFVGFFPQLVAGPIVRAGSFLPQLDSPRVLNSIDIPKWTWMFLIGFIKKACIADNLAPIVDAYFSNPLQFTNTSAWIASLGYTIQIYCDFSGYSEMAIATAGFLGYQLPTNFKFPYFSRSPQELWQRWHISLSTWFRDYVYRPLGGNRVTTLRWAINTMIVFMVSGLWHGANWTFVVWGIYHGLWLALSQMAILAPLSRRIQAHFLGRSLSVLATFMGTSVGFVIFRSQTLPDAALSIRQLFGLGQTGAETIAGSFIILYIVLAAIHLVFMNGWITRRIETLHPAISMALVGVLFAISLTFVPLSHTPFIYFQF